MCVCVCVSVRPFVALVYSIKMAEPACSQAVCVIGSRDYCLTPKILMKFNGITLKTVGNAGGIGKICNF